MSEKSDPVTIKKYANRRLYNTGTSTYVTLDDLAEMVKKGDDFVVEDAKSGDDITHAVLTQIIFELENQDGQNMLPIPFLRQLIAFYGDQMQMVVPSYLEQSMAAFSREQERIREQMETIFAGKPMGSMGEPFKAIEEQTRRNIEIFQQAMSVFTPFGTGGEAEDGKSGPEGDQESKDAKPSVGDLDELKEQIAAMQKKIDSMGG